MTADEIAGFGATAAGFLPGSPGNPSQVFSQVNPTVSVECDRSDGLNYPLAHKGPETFKSEENLNNDSDSALVADHPSEPGSPSHPARLSWSTAPVWAERWQGKYDRETTALGRFDCAARILAAAVRKGHPDDELMDELCAWMLRSATAIGEHAAVPKLNLPAAPTLPAAPAVPKRHTYEYGGRIAATRECPCTHCQWVLADADEYGVFRRPIDGGEATPCQEPRCVLCGHSREGR